MVARNHPENRKFDSQVTATPTSKFEPLLMSEIPNKLWDTVALDLKGPFPTCENLLVLIDYRSSFPFISVLKTTTANTIIKTLLKIFTTFTYPKYITTDNESQFKSMAIRTFLIQHNIKLPVVTLCWPSANGEVERFNRTFGKAIQCSHAEGKDWQQEIEKFLLQYTATPHTITNVPPAQLMFRHTPRNDLPSVESNNKPNKADKQVNKDDQKRKDKIGEYANNKRKAKSVTVTVSDKVLLRNIHHANKLNTIWKNQTYTVLKVYPRSLKLQNDNTRSVYVRSKVHIKMYHQQPHKPNAQTSSRHRSHYQVDTDINSE